jgi:hypothetical protein
MAGADRAVEIGQRLIEQQPQVISAEVGIALDAGESAATEFPVQGTTSACLRPAFFKRT